MVQQFQYLGWASHREVHNPNGHFEADTAGGKMAGGIIEEGGPDDHPLPVSMASWLSHSGSLGARSVISLLFFSAKE